MKSAPVIALAAMAAPSFATVTEALPTELAPTAMIAAVTGESSLWLTVGIPVIVGLSFLVALKRGMTGKATKGVR